MATDNKAKDNNKFKLFADRVSVAGLEESYRAPLKQIRITFRIAIFLATAAIFYYSWGIVCSYWHKGAVFDIYDKIGIQAPFPNVTICGPEALKVEVARELLNTLASASDWRMMEKLLREHNMTLDEAIEIAVKEVLPFAVRPKPKITSLEQEAAKGAPDTSVSREMMKFGEQVMNKIPGHYFSFLRMAHPSCDQMFTKCTFDRITFNCCQATDQIPFDSRVCYQLSLDLVPELANLSTLIGGKTEDPMWMQKTGLTIEVAIHWPDVVYIDDLANDGFDIFVGAPLHWSNPITIPSDADAQVILAPPTQLEEMSNCRPARSAQPHFEDPYGAYCVIEQLAGYSKTYYGCALPSKATDLDGNNTYLCTPVQLVQLISILDGSMFKNSQQNDASSNKFFTGYWKQETMMRELGKSAFSKCRPLCTRFLYKIFSSSYATFHNKQQNKWDGAKWNNSWSRINIFYPTASYTIHSEEVMSPIYMAVCEVGGLMGIYLGLSMITLVQILAYGLLTLQHCKKRRVQVAATE